MTNCKFFIVCCLLCIACDAESDSYADTNTPPNAITAARSTMPIHAANMYDSAGQLHNRILEEMLTAGKRPLTATSAITDIETIGYVLPEFVTLLPPLYVSPNPTVIDVVLSDNTYNTASAIAPLGLSSYEKYRLILFVDSLIESVRQLKDYQVIYEDIVTYENTVIYSGTITADDKKIILTTTSISRHAIHFAYTHRRKPRDRDWEVSWGNIMTGCIGSAQSQSAAIVMSASAAILTNKLY